MLDSRHPAGVAGEADKRGKTMSKKKLGFMAGLLSAVCAVTAHADGLGYTYLDLDYFHLSPDTGSAIASHNAYGLVGSYALPDNFVLSGGYTHSSYDADKIIIGLPKQTENDYQLGLNYRIPLDEGIDLVPGLAYVSNHLDFPGGTFGTIQFIPYTADGKGYDLSLTPRFQVTPSLELNASVDHFHVRYYYENSFGFALPTINSSGNGASVGAVYSFTPGFALGGDYHYSTAEGLTNYAYDVFARFYF